jgi:hypothetical protein
MQAAIVSYEKSFSILADIQDSISTSGRKLGVNIDRRLVQETPRKTGSAKSSWLVSLSQPDNNIVDVDEGEADTAVMQAIEAGAISASKFKSGDTLYIQNNQPYIQRLNEGWSDQAGTGYIDDIIEEEVRRAD